MKKIIVIEKENKFQYDSIEELVEDLLDEDYYNMSNEQKKEILNKKATLNSLNKKGVTVQTENEYTYILSLANLNIITILERKDADIFLKGWDKEKFEGNYIVINKIAEKLIMQYA